ncbi:hypothetical protein DMENIID0001_160330 [Sergentomyia squamirostris]
MVVLPDAVVPSKKVQLKDVNECITCHICKGYIIDATTIVECCHSFCHSCIVPHLRTKEYCPKCELIINKTKPNIKPDATFQAIVYKLVPGLYEKELLRRRAFYSSHPEEAKLATPEQRGEDIEHLIFRPTEKISLSLEYAFINEHRNRSPELAKPKYLQCPAIFPVSLLAKFVMTKFGIDSTQFNVDIMYKVKTIVLPEYYTLMDVAYIYTWKREAPMRFFYRVRTKESKSEELPEVPLRRSPSINRQAPVATAGDTPTAASVEPKRKEVEMKLPPLEQKTTPKGVGVVKKDISDNKCMKVEKQVVEKVVKVGKSSSGKKKHEDKSEKSRDTVKIKKEKIDGEKKCENIKMKIGLSKDRTMIVKDISTAPAKRPSTTLGESVNKTTRDKMPQVSVKIEKSPDMPSLSIPIHQARVKKEPKSPDSKSPDPKNLDPKNPETTTLNTPTVQKNTANSQNTTENFKNRPIKQENKDETSKSKHTEQNSKNTEDKSRPDLEEISKSQFLNSFELTAKNKINSIKPRESTKTAERQESSKNLNTDKKKLPEPSKSIKNRLPELPNLISPPNKTIPSLPPPPTISTSDKDGKKPLNNGFLVPKTESAIKKKDEQMVPRRKYTNFVKIAPKQSPSSAAALMNSAAFIGGSGTSKLSIRSSSTPSRIAPPRRQSVTHDNSRILQDTFSMLQKNSTEIKKIEGKETKVYGPQMGPPMSPCPTTGLPMPRTPLHVPEYWNFSMRNGSPKGYGPFLGMSSPLHTPSYSPNSPQYAPTYNLPISQSQFKYAGYSSNGSSNLPPPTSKSAADKEVAGKKESEKPESKRSKSTSPTKEDGEPPEKTRKVQSLLNSCNITFPSSLSITLTNDQNDADVNKSVKIAKPQKPVNNYIEILKLPSDGATTVTPIPAPEDNHNGKPTSPKGKDLLTKVNELTTKAVESSKKSESDGEKGKKCLPKLNPIDKSTPTSVPSATINFTDPAGASFQHTYLKSLLNQSVYKDKMQNKLYDLKTNKIIPVDTAVTSSTSEENGPSPPPPKKSKSEPSSLVKTAPTEESTMKKSTSALDLTANSELQKLKKLREMKKSRPRTPKPDLNLLPSLPLIPPPTSSDLLMAGLTPGFGPALNYPFLMEQYQRMRKAGSEALEMYFQNLQKNMGVKGKHTETTHHSPPVTTPTTTTVSSTVTETDK